MNYIIFGVKSTRICIILIMIICVIDVKLYMKYIKYNR